jgi:hypothetical protein
MDKLANTLTGMGHPISADTVHKELVKLGFSRQHNRKAAEGARHRDRVVPKARSSMTRNSSTSTPRWLRRKAPGNR